MKKWMMYGTILLSVGMLVACSSKKENVDVTDELKALRKSVFTTSQVTETASKTTKAPATKSTTEKALWAPLKTSQKTYKMR